MPAGLSSFWEGAIVPKTLRLRTRRAATLISLHLAYSKQRRPEVRAGESEADGEQVAKHLRRAQPAVPLRRKNRDALFARGEARWRSKRGPSTAFRARANRGKSRTARNSAQDDGARESGADGEQVAKHLRRAQRAVPLPKTPLRFARGASAIEERFLAAFRARKQRARGKNTRNSARNDGQMKGKAPIARLAGEYCTWMGRGCRLSAGLEVDMGSGNKLACSGIGANSCRVTRPHPRKNNQRP
jgi:hypothetical protein